MSDPTYMDSGNECCNASESWEDCVILDTDGLPHAECYQTVCNGCDKIIWLDCEA